MMITTFLAENGPVLAELNANSADGIRGIVLGIVGSLAIAVLVSLLFMKFGEQRHGAMIGVLIAGALVLGVAAFPDAFSSSLAGLAGQFFGGN